MVCNWNGELLTKSAYTMSSKADNIVGHPYRGVCYVIITVFPEGTPVLGCIWRLKGVHLKQGVPPTNGLYSVPDITLFLQKWTGYTFISFICFITITKLRTTHKLTAIEIPDKLDW